MPFKRNYGRGKRPFGWKRKIPFKALPRNVARKRKQWLTLYNDGGLCRFQCVPVEACPDVPFHVELVSNQSLQQFFGDNVTVEALRGNLYFRPWTVRPNICDKDDWREWIVAMERQMFHMRLGLIKSRITADDIDGPTLDPLSGYDWSEQRWLKEWTHTWPSRGRDAWETTKPYLSWGGVCSEVHQPSYNIPGWTMVTGSGTWAGVTVPETQTDCIDHVTEPEVGCYADQTARRAKEQPWWRMPVGMRKRINLRENDRLDIWGNMANVIPDWETGGSCADNPDCLVDAPNAVLPCRLNMMANVKMLISYG